MKKCSICNIIKENTCFRKSNKVKSKLSSQCKECDKVYRNSKTEKTKEYMKEYYKKNQIKLKTRAKTYRRDNVEIKKKTDKIYRENNRKKINEHSRIRKELDPVYALKCNVRSMLKNSFRRRGERKYKKGEEIMGCDITFFIKHLTETYESNYKEKWDWSYLKNVHIDHIIPLANANNELEIIKLCHYTNLQLLKAKDNFEKKDRNDWRIKDYGNSNML